MKSATVCRRAADCDSKAHERGTRLIEVERWPIRVKRSSLSAS